MIKQLTGAAIAAFLCSAGVTVFATEATSDGLRPAQNMDFHHVPGADQAVDSATTPMADDAWLFIAGSAFTPRTSNQVVTYAGGGCTYSNQALTTSLELPESARIEGVRLYYYNANSSSNVRLFLSKYPGDGSLQDLLIAPSTTSSGYASEYMGAASAFIVNNSSGSYVLTAVMDIDTRLCGMRVFYTP